MHHAGRSANLELVAAACRCLYDNFAQGFAFLPAYWQAVGRGSAPLLQEGDYQDQPARALPMLDQLPACLALANEATRPLVKTLSALRDKLAWQQSYTREDGFDQRYLDHYGWINLLSPDGPIVSQELRLTIGYWGAGLSYPCHWHAPEEVYCILAGHAVFESDGHPPRHCGPGDWVHHRPNQPHAIDMSPGPLLALVPWRGANLTAKSGFNESS